MFLCQRLVFTSFDAEKINLTL